MPQRIETATTSRPFDTGVVPRAGVEPARPCGHRFLRPTRLPVPPPRRCPAGARPYYRSVRWGLFTVLILLLNAVRPDHAPKPPVNHHNTDTAYTSRPCISLATVTVP